MQFTHEDIARHFFEISRWLGSEPVGSGNVNDTFCIHFESRQTPAVYILQRLNHQVFRNPEAVMDNIYQVTRHLAQHGFPYQSPAPVRTLDGMLYHRDEAGNYWRCFPFVEASYAPEGRVDAGMAYQSARAYGAFARALQGFPANELAETIPGFHDTDQRWAVFTETLAKDPVQRVAGCLAEIDAIYRAKPVFDKISGMKSSGMLPLRVTHNDTKAGNVLLDARTHTAKAVIDLDTVMPGTILSDFGDMVRSFVPDRSEDATEQITLQPAVLAALKTGFLEETEDFLTGAEKENLLLGGAWITGEQALRFLSDWLAGDTYYKIKYPEHNLVRARNQIRVFELLESLL